MEKISIPVLLGTGRVDNSSKLVADFVTQQVEKNEKIETQLVQVEDFKYTETTPPWGSGGTDESPTKWKEIMTKADGLIIVVPEYNHGYPGELKLVLDSLYKEYEKKPVLLCGVSAGGLGGARVVENMLPVMIGLKMVPIPSTLYFSGVGKLFNKDGLIQEEGHEERIAKALTELISYADTLKKARS